jgi:hypothetical protein
MFLTLRLLALLQLYPALPRLLLVVRLLRLWLRLVPRNSPVSPLRLALLSRTASESVPINSGDYLIKALLLVRRVFISSPALLTEKLRLGPEHCLVSLETCKSLSSPRDTLSAS